MQTLWFLEWPRLKLGETCCLTCLITKRKELLKLSKKKGRVWGEEDSNLLPQGAKRYRAEHVGLLYLYLPEHLTAFCDHMKFKELFGEQLHKPNQTNDLLGFSTVAACQV